MAFLRCWAFVETCWNEMNNEDFRGDSVVFLQSKRNLLAWQTLWDLEFRARSCVAILLMVQKSSIHQLIWVSYPTIYNRVSYMSGGWPWDFWTINRSGIYQTCKLLDVRPHSFSNNCSLIFPIGSMVAWYIYLAEIIGVSWVVPWFFESTHPGWFVTLQHNLLGHLPTCFFFPTFFHPVGSCGVPKW